MNAFAPGDFGEFEALLKALGLADEGGAFNADWISRPEFYLSRMLADDDQRAALLEFVSTVRDGGAETDPDGRLWIELFSEQVRAGLDAKFFVVVDDRPTGQVHLFLGVRMDTRDPLAEGASSLLFPLFRAAKSGGPPLADPILAGRPGGSIALSSEITLRPAPAPGQAGLRSIGLRIAVPTAPGDGDADVGLTLGGLQLPGEAEARDLTLSLSDPTSLQDAASELILGLLQAQIGEAVGPQVEAFANLLGLGGDATIPSLSVSDVLDRGAGALADWLADVLGATPSRARWLQALADLFGAGAVADDTGIDLDMGGAIVRIGLLAEPGPSARPVVTASIAVSLTEGPVEARFAADLVRLDLATGAALALPRVQADVAFDLNGLAMPDVSVARLVLGFALDSERRPILVAAAEQAQVFGTLHPRLDLTNPEALAAQAASAVTDVLNDLLSRLGPGADLIGVALGLRAPDAASGLYPTVDPIAFLGDPLGRLRDHWRVVFADHAGDVANVLAAMRALMTGVTDVAEITGDGTDAAPWRLPITAGVHLAVWRTAEEGIALGLGYLTRVDNLGQGCTVIEMRGRVALLSVNLTTAATAFVPDLRLSILGRARGGGRLVNNTGDLELEADHLGLLATWSPTGRLDVRLDAPNPTVSIGGLDLSLDLPDFAAGLDPAAITQPQWGAIERIIGLLVGRTDNRLLVAVADMLGWRRTLQIFGSADAHRLPLGTLLSDPEVALRSWLGGLIADGTSDMAARLDPFARLLSARTQAAAGVSGAGTLTNPWQVALPGGAPNLAAWRMPGRDIALPDRSASRPLRSWRPGDEALRLDTLALAIQSELPDVVGGFGLAELINGLTTLIEAWTGTDGLVRPAGAPPAGVQLHLVAGRDADSLIDAAEVETFLGEVPTALFVVRTLSHAAAPPTGIDPTQMIDLRDPDRDAGAFPQVPLTATGTWTLLLAPRAEARLDAGDPDGTQGQMARLAHALAPAAGIAGAAVLADRAAGHAAWLALNDMGPGLDRLLAVGLVLTPDAAPTPLDPVASETLRRLDEILPALDPGDPDDADLTVGRGLIGARLAAAAPALGDLQPPPGWTGARRAGLQVFLVQGVVDQDAAARALTAVVAAGLSLVAQSRASRTPPVEKLGMGVGLSLPLGPPPAAGAIGLGGRALVELLGVGLDRSGDQGAMPTARVAGRIVLTGRIARGDGWLVGGPGTDGPPPPLELRAIEIAVDVGAGGRAEPGLDVVEIVLIGARVYGESFPRLIVSPSLPDDVIGLNGLAAPTAPGIRALLAGVLEEAAVGGDATLAHFLTLLRATGILGAGDGFDPLSLSNWIDDPAGQLTTALGNPALRAQLLSLIESRISSLEGVSFDAATGRLDVTLGGETGEDVLGEWTFAASLDAQGTSSGALRLGRVDGPGVGISLVPFEMTLDLPEGLADPANGVPASLPLWPAPNLAPLGRTLLPMMAATALSRVIQGLRDWDPTVAPIVEAGLAAFGLDETEAVTIPPVFFSDPAAWLARNGVLGGPGGSVSAPRVIAMMEALRPLVGVAGGPGVWTLAPGLALAARNDGGLVVEAQIDPAAFLLAGTITVGGAFGLRFPAGGGASRPAVSVFAGPPGGGPTGRQSAHLTVAGEDVALFLRPQAGADIALYPGPADLSGLAAAGLVAALPTALDAIVETGSDAGNLLAEIGDALALRQGGAFDAAALATWTSDPAGALAARWTPLLAGILAPLGPALPTGVTVGATPDGLRVEVANAGTPGSTVAIVFGNDPIFVEVSAAVQAIPFVGEIDTTFRFDATGLARVQAEIGPAEIPLGAGLILRPLVDLDVGAAVAAPRIGTGLALDAGAAQVLRLTYDLNAENFALSFGDDSPAQIAGGLMHVAIEILGTFVLDLDAVEALLDLPIGSGSDTVRDVLDGVILTPAGTLDPEFFRAVPAAGESGATLLTSKRDRILTLIGNIADTNPTVRIADEVDIGLGRSGGVVGLTLAVANRLELFGGDIALWLENDSRWIIGGPAPGLEIGLLRLGPGGADFEPSLSVNGVGVRIGRSSAPLLDEPISLGSIAIHGFARVGAGELLGGAQVELAEIGAPVGGGSGQNAIASGLLSETSEGESRLAPTFSPALAVQTRPPPDNGVAFSFRAGDGTGPWWLPLRKSFGPLYLDQVGLDTQVQDDSLQSLSLLFDGSVSIAGLTASVDDLELVYRTDAGGLFDTAAWGVDLAGLGVSADLSGMSLAGGLRKFGEDEDIEYVGMLAARFAVYGLSIYGGYASTSDTQGRFTSFFAVGAVLGPIGGPPAFFVTGIGGGFGINRDLVPPTDLSKFGDFVLIRALDPAVDLPSDVIAYLGEVREVFPSVRGNFWFAAGISFTSFALVDGVAVVAVEFGNGFELAIFGLARMALPRPAFALVSMELGLLARVSAQEGVIWIQAQLTDNSWLLHKSVRLTGGFAYVSWFKGPNRGQFVLSLGGYHPNFDATGYPVVPRLGYNWSVGSNIVLKGESYFALTSEAVMAGTLTEASAKFGSAFAHLSFGGDAIIYFDPFSYLATAHARVSAGIRIKTWFGTIKLSFTLGAEILVAGPEFHGVARIKVGPINVTVRFGDQGDPPMHYISWVEFSGKYLELAAGNQAAALSGIAGQGALPPASEAGEPNGTADGSFAHPFDVMSEFELSLTSTIPLTRIIRPGRDPIERDPSGTLGVSPSNLVVSEITLTLQLRRLDAPNVERFGDLKKIKLRTRDTGAFPVGVWGPPPGLDDRTVPKGKVITATEGIDLRFVPDRVGRVPAASTGGVAFDQIEAGPRKPLPLREVGQFFATLVSQAQDHRLLLAGIDDARMAQLSAGFQAQGRTTTARRSWRGARAAPMRVGLLTERIVRRPAPGRKRVFDTLAPTRPSVKFGPARIRGILALPSVPVGELRGGPARSGTRLPAGVDLKRIVRQRPPSLTGILAARQTHAPALLLRSAPDTVAGTRTVVAERRIPVTLGAGGPNSASAARATGADRRHLQATAAMAGVQGLRGGGNDKVAPEPLSQGEMAVFDLPGATRSRRFKTGGSVDLDGPSRIVALGLNGSILANRPGARGRIDLPKGTAAFAVIAGDTDAGGTPEFAGWTDADALAYLGRSLARCRGGFVFAEGANRTRGGARSGCGWIRAGALTEQSGLVDTRFDTSATSVALLLEGTVTAADLETIAIAVRGAEVTEDAPILAPFDGKTIVAYRLKSEGGGMSVRVAGLLPGRLDGVIAAAMDPARLVARLVNDSVVLTVGVARAASGGPVTFRWRPPADVEPRPVEEEEF